jgi:hypothetical protein
MSNRTENLIALAGAALIAVALVAGMCWHASVVDRAVDAHKACLNVTANLEAR